ncbi:MAG: flagellar export chaperone FlgN [Pseudomonadales bacterium]
MTNNTKIEFQLDTLIELFAHLHDHLISERAALRADDQELLRQAVAAKQQSLAAIHNASTELGTVPIKDLIAAAPVALRPKLEQRHSLLQQQAENAKEYNAVNGKIIARSQQSLQALMRLMSPGADALIYSERGGTSRASGGTAFAQA